MTPRMKYILVTIALSALGYIIGSITFAYIIVTLWWGLPVVLIVGPFSLFLFFAVSYYTVILLNILWWYPAVVLSVPSIIWIILFIFSSPAKPQSFPEAITVSLAIILMVLVELYAGFLGLNHRRMKDAERAD
jgi:hypothetical protein